MGERGVLTGGDDLSRYEISPNNFDGHATIVVRPGTVEQLRGAIAACASAGLHVLPQGANSGLVGDSVPRSELDVVISTERLKDVFEVDTVSRTLTASAGWTLSEIGEKLRPHCLRFPIEVGSSPALGGMVSTNTAGSNVIRYGTVRKRLLGVEAVLPYDGQPVVSTLPGLRKRNEGFDVAQLFVGTQGQFGFVTAACLELDPIPAARAAAWIELTDSAGLLPLFERIDEDCGPFLTAFELASANAVRLLRFRFPQLLKRVPSTNHDCVLAELGTPAAFDAHELLVSALARVDKLAFVGDAIVGPPADLRAVRHTIPVITEKMDSVLSFDVAVPRSAITRLRGELARAVGDRWPQITIIELGHVGDGGLHLILQYERGGLGESSRSNVSRCVFDVVVGQFGGTISAEHGIGPKNLDAYDAYVDFASRSLRERVRAVCDPDAIMTSMLLKTPSSSS